MAASSGQSVCSSQHVVEGDCPKCGNTISLALDRFKNPLYINWIKCSLSMQFMKEGLENVTTMVAQKMYEYVEEDLHSALACESNQNIDLLDHIKTCTKPYCRRLNTNLGLPPTSKSKTSTQLTKYSLPWDLAVLYMTNSPRKPESAHDGDSTALLSFMENCWMSLDVISDTVMITKARETRNKITHSCDMQLEGTALDEYANIFLAVLKDPKHLERDAECQKARKNIEELLGNRVQINLVKEKEDEVLKDHFKQVDETIDQLYHEVQMSEDKEEIEKCKQSLKKIEISLIKTKKTMEVFNIESTTADNVNDKINQISEKTLEKRTEVEISGIVKEKNKLTKDNHKLNQALDIATQETELQKKNNQWLKERLEKAENQPHHDGSRDKVDIKLNKYYPDIPFIGEIQGGLCDGMVVMISGTPNKKRNRFAVDFYAAGDIAFHFNPRFYLQMVVRNSCLAGIGWGEEERAGEFPFCDDQHFDLVIHVKHHFYQVSVNGKHFCNFNHRVPSQHVTDVRILDRVTVEHIRVEVGSLPYIFVEQ